MNKHIIFKFAVLIIIGIYTATYNTSYSSDGVTAVKLMKEQTAVKNPITVSNKLFSVSLPKETKSLFSIKKGNDYLFIYDKISKKAGFGGFAFGIKAFKNPSEHAMIPGGRKLGELVDKKGTVYDMVLLQPTDVQYDYINNKYDSYYRLYNTGEKIGTQIKGNNGSSYFNNRGMKGKDLYKDIISKHIKAIQEKWDSEKLEKENMSYMYNVIAQSSKNVIRKVGYKYFDVNGDGIDELFIGEIANDAWRGIIYDIYTMVDRKPAHVVSGGSGNRYFVCDDAFICNEYSSGANESVKLVYNLVENSTELFPQVGFKYDGYTNKKKPWFISYDINADKWEPIPEKDYKERKSIFDRYERFIFTPLYKYNEN